MSNLSVTPPSRTLAQLRADLAATNSSLRWLRDELNEAKIDRREALEERKDIKAEAEVASSESERANLLKEAAQLLSYSRQLQKTLTVLHERLHTAETRVVRLEQEIDHVSHHGSGRLPDGASPTVPVPSTSSLNDDTHQLTDTLSNSVSSVTSSTGGARVGDADSPTSPSPQPRAHSPEHANTRTHSHTNTHSYTPVESPTRPADHRSVRDGTSSGWDFARVEVAPRSSVASVELEVASTSNNLPRRETAVVELESATTHTSRATAEVAFTTPPRKRIEPSRDFEHAEQVDSFHDHSIEDEVSHNDIASANVTTDDNTMSVRDDGDNDVDENDSDVPVWEGTPIAPQIDPVDVARRELLAPRRFRFLYANEEFEYVMDYIISSKHLESALRSMLQRDADVFLIGFFIPGQSLDGEVRMRSPFIPLSVLVRMPGLVPNSSILVPVFEGDHVPEPCAPVGALSSHSSASRRVHSQGLPLSRSKHQSLSADLPAGSPVKVDSQEGVQTPPLFRTRSLDRYSGKKLSRKEKRKSKNSRRSSESSTSDKDKDKDKDKEKKSKKKRKSSRSSSRKGSLLSL